MLAGPWSGRPSRRNRNAAFALFRRDDVDAHRLFQIDAVVVDETFGLEAAVGPFGESLAQRTRRFEQAVVAREIFSLPNLATSSLSRRSPRRSAPSWPRMSPSTSSGVRLLAAMMRSISVRLEAALIAHRRQVQALVESLARLSEQLPGTGPPMSLLCAIEPQKPNSSPSTNTGASTQMSGACGLPP